MMTQETATKSWSKSKATDQAIAGFMAGALSTIVLHPLDLVKVRLQVQEHLTPSAGRQSLWSLLSSIFKSRGVAGLYRGLSPNFLGSTVSWGMYFYFYSSIKQEMEGRNNGKNNDSKNLSPVEHLTASAFAGLTTCLFANPLFVIKTRMFTQKWDDPQRYRGLYHGLKTIYSTEGVAGLYRGILPAMFGVSHGAIQFMAYEQLKIMRKDSGLAPPTAFMGNVEYIGMAVISKIFAALFTYPYQVVKSRMQTESKYLTMKYDGVFKTVSSIYSYEGIGGFYKGLRINIIRVLPGTMITFGAYETISGYFKKHAS